jgi:predicted transcriptional regulator
MMSETTTTTNTPNITELAASIVSAYVTNNAVAAGDLAGLINEVTRALGGTVAAPSSGETGVQAGEPQKPAVKPNKSIFPDFIVCLEDGKKFKSLKRHLRTQYGLSPEGYREKWGLPSDYPMVAPNYAEARSQLAKNMGLGMQRGARKRAA